jgi:hypothetical protein
MKQRGRAAERLASGVCMNLISAGSARNTRGDSRDGTAMVSASLITWSLAAAGGYPKGQLTLGYAEFSVATGKLVTIAGAWQGTLAMSQPKPPGQPAYLPTDFPYVLWTSPDAETLIGVTNGQAVILSDGRSQPILWPSTLAAEGVFPSATW